MLAIIGEKMYDIINLEALPPSMNAKVRGLII